VVLGFALPVFIVAFTTLMQRRTPNRLMGRVSAAADVVLGTPQAISIAVGALVVSLVSYRTMYWMCAAVIAAAACYLVLALRRLDAAVLVSGHAQPEPTQSAVPDAVVTSAVPAANGVSAGDGDLDERGEDGSELEAGRLDGQGNQ